MEPPYELDRSTIIGPGKEHPLDKNYFLYNFSHMQFDSIDLQFLFRWLHLLASFLWLGHLYFLNWSLGPFFVELNAEHKQLLINRLWPRALWWFRWSAMVTVLAGFGILYLKYFQGTGASGMSGDGGLMTSLRGQWLSLGATIGLLMWFNVWFLLWPRQKKIMQWMRTQQNPPEMQTFMQTIRRVSKFNTYASGPMLFGMAAGSGFFVHSMKQEPIWLAIALVGPVILIHLGFMLADRKIAKEN